MQERSLEPTTRMSENENKQDHGKEMVQITINNKPYEIHRGNQTVAAIKQIGGVPLADYLDELIDGKFVHLPDDGSVTIKDGEIFVSQPKDGGSS